MSIDVTQLEGMIRKAVKDMFKEYEEQQPQPTETHSEHVAGCKDCYTDFVKKQENMPYRCEDCDLPLPDSMVGNELSPNSTPCPRCGSTEAYKVEE